MRVDYNVGCDGWTEHPRGRIEISDHVWRILSKETGCQNPSKVIPCQIGFTDTAQLLAVAKAIDAELEKETTRHSVRDAV